MASNEYHLISHWRVEGTVAEVSAILQNASDLVRWWPAVYLAVRELAPGDERGVGKIVSLYTKDRLRRPEKQPTALVQSIPDSPSPTLPLSSLAFIRR